MENNAIPFKRNWLEEAYKIAHGDTKIQLKKEHVRAAIETIKSFSEDVEKLRGMMRFAYEQACKSRKEHGLPIPPPPPSLNAEVKLPWKT